MNAKLFVKCAIGAALGGTIAYILVDRIYSLIDDRRYQKYLRELEEIEEVDNTTEKILVNFVDEEERKHEEQWIPAEPLPKSDRKKNKKPVDYSSIRSVTKPDLAVMAHQVVDGKYIVSEEVYCTRDESYTSRELSYYDGDDVLVDEEENVIASPEELIGQDALLKFGQLSNDPDIVYLRDEKNKVQYEIARVNGSYSKIVLGYSDEDLKKSKRTKKKEVRENE